VSRGVQDFELGGTEFENVAFLEILVRVFHRGAFVDVNVRPRCQAQLLVAADMIGMHMGVDDMGDLHALFPGDVR
jgi:hypothetical protein